MICPNCKAENNDRPGVCCACGFVLDLSVPAPLPQQKKEKNERAKYSWKMTGLAVLVCLIGGAPMVLGFDLLIFLFATERGYKEDKLWYALL